LSDSIPKTLVDTLNMGMTHRTLSDRISADYVVMAVTMIVWIGIFLYLMRLDRLSKEIEKQ